MADVKWIKICTDIFDDEKMCLIESMPEADGIIVCWFKLLCLAGKQNNSGVFMLNDRIAYTDEMLAAIFRRPVNMVRLALKTFQGFGMIDIVDNVYTIPHWEKHQSLDAYEKKKARDRKLQAERRARQKALLLKSSDASSDISPDVALSDIDKERDIDIEEDKEKSKKKASSRFTPPTLEEVQAYCRERGNNVDAERFINYYTANGWKVGKNSMKDWKAAVRTWERSDAKPAQKKDGSEYADLV